VEAKEPKEKAPQSEEQNAEADEDEDMTGVEDMVVTRRKLANLKNNSKSTPAATM